MRKQKGIVLALIVVFLMSTLVVGCAPKEEVAPAYPTKPITALIGFGAGGPGDVIGRGILPILQEVIGQPIAITNVPGASGATAADQVLKAPKDGYTVYFGTEIMSVWQTMDILNASPTKDFVAVKLTSEAIPVLAVPPDSKFKTMEEFVAFAKANPGKLKIGTAGPATVPHVSGLILQQALGTQFTFVPFQGGKPAITAVMGGQVDATIEMVQAMVESYKGKQLNILASFTNEPVAGLPEVPQAGKIFPELAKYLPYGPYFGLFVAKDVPADVVKVLEEGMDKAMKDQRWIDYQKTNMLVPINISGQAAVDYLSKWTSKSAWILFDGGAGKKSPADFGIAKPTL